MLTYCTNIHPGETWSDVLANLAAHVLRVKDSTSPDRAFPLGLRVSAAAAREIDASEAARFRDWCSARDLFVLTLNGFPHGRFHGPGVKQRVYLPDWRDPERVAYTCRLADLLATWLPEGCPGSISTVPIAFAAGWDDADWPLAIRHIRAVHDHLEALADARGAAITLAVEPEPCCVLETSAELLAFVERARQGTAGLPHLGACLDACHHAVEFEEPAQVLEALAGADIPIGKVQVSSSLRAAGDEVGGLAGFDEPTYLHQTVTRGEDGVLSRYPDLPDFLAARQRGEVANAVEARVHFHVPIFARHLGTCGTTQSFLEGLLPQLDPATPLEVETYSFDVLPASLRMADVADSIARELTWVQAARPDLAAGTGGAGVNE